MKKLLKSPLFWIGIVLATILIVLISMNPESIGVLFPKKVLIDTFISTGLLMIAISIIMLVVYIIDSKKNGKYRKEIKVGDKTIVSVSNHSGEAEVIEIDGNVVYVKMKFHKNNLIKPKNEHKGDLQ